MGLGGPVVCASPIGDADRRHQGDARRLGAESDQDIAHTAIVDSLCPDLSSAV
jgi:hypothetical protein